MVVGKQASFIVFDELSSLPRMAFTVDFLTLFTPAQQEQMRQHLLRVLILMLHVTGRGRVAQICNLIDQHRQVKEFIEHDTVFASW